MAVPIKPDYQRWLCVAAVFSLAILLILLPMVTVEGGITKDLLVRASYIYVNNDLNNEAATVYMYKADGTWTAIRFNKAAGYYDISTDNGSTWNRITTEDIDSGESNTMSNLGAGVGIYEGKVGVDFRLYSLQPIHAALGLYQSGNVIQLDIHPGAIVHNGLQGLNVGDPHTQYHNETRGDARYFQKSEHLDSSAGAGDAGKPIKLDAGGKVDETMINDPDIDHGSVGGLGDDDHSQYHNNTRGDARYLHRENVGAFTPDGDYEPATKKYVDDNSASPAGADTNVQYNDGGSFGGEAAWTYDDTLNHMLLSQGVLAVGNTVRIYETAGGTLDYYVDIKASDSLAANWTMTLPLDDGDADQYLKTDGSGGTTWATPGGGGDMLKATYDADEDNEIDVAGGGTEKDSWTQYAIPYLSDTTVFGEIGIGTAGYVLAVNGTTNGYLWLDIDGTYVKLVETSAVDFGGASLKLPTATSGDVTVTEGQIKQKSHEDGFALHGGSAGEIQDEYFMSGLTPVAVHLDPGMEYDRSTDTRLFSLGDAEPNGIKIVEWSMDFGMDPDVEADVDLCYADDWAQTNETVLDALDTTNGTSSDDAVALSVPAGKYLYLRWNDDPEGTGDYLTLEFLYYKEED